MFLFFEKKFHFPFLLFLLGCASSNINLDIGEITATTCDKSVNMINHLCQEEYDLLTQTEKKITDQSLDFLFSKDNLKQIQDENGFPFSVAFFTMGLLRLPSTAAYIGKVSSLNIISEKKRLTHKVKNIHLIVIPGLFYDINKEIGGDGKQLRTMASNLGFNEGIIEVKPTGSIQQNGEIICNWIKQTNINKIILLSISKGSADFKEAVNQCKEVIFKDKKIISWINLGGINKGSYLVNQADSSFIKRIYVKYLGMKYGFSYDAFLSVKAGIKKSVLNEEFEIPSGLRVINIIPAPLERYVTDRAYENFRALSSLGPNDGLSLLGDSYMSGAINIPIWGIDHYFRVNKQDWEFLQKLILYESQN